MLDIDQMSMDKMMIYLSQSKKIIERIENMCQLANEKEKAVEEKWKVVEAQAEENHVKKKALLEEQQKLKEERVIFAAEQQSFDDLRRRVDEAAVAADDLVELCVRGQNFSTRKSNLMVNKKTFFYGMLSSGRFKPNARGKYFIDRYFSFVLLRVYFLF